MIIYKIIDKLKNKYKKYQLRCQNIELKKSIKKNKGKIGRDVNFGRNVVISGQNNLEIGQNVQIGTNCFIRADGGLKIGNNVILSRNIVLYTTSHNYNGKLLPFDNTNVFKPVIIEDNVWVGMNVTISPGTIIREGAIIGLGSTIFGEIPKGAIVGSNQPKIISKRDLNHYNLLKKTNSYCKEDGKKY